MPIDGTDRAILATLMPTVQRLHGQRLPDSFGMVKTRRGVEKNRLLATKRTFTKHGQSGVEVSDLLPHLSKVVDEITVLRSMHTPSPALR